MSYRSLDEAEASLRQDLFPDQAYFIFATVRTWISFEKTRIPDLISKGQKVVIYP